MELVAVCHHGIDQTVDQLVSRYGLLGIRIRITAQRLDLCHALGHFVVANDNRIGCATCVGTLELRLEAAIAPFRRSMKDDVKAGIASAIDWPDGAADLVFTSGVLIHIHPDQLHASMREIHRASARWIVSVEYFSDGPTEVAYRGHSGVLFKRDFGSEWLELFPELRPVAYGFEWKRVTGLDNLTWWLFQKP